MVLTFLYLVIFIVTLEKTNPQNLKVKSCHHLLIFRTDMDLGFSKA